MSIYPRLNDTVGQECVKGRLSLSLNLNLILILNLPPTPTPSQTGAGAVCNNARHWP
jgi:hypothetical protein